MGSSILAHASIVTYLDNLPQAHAILAAFRATGRTIVEIEALGLRVVRSTTARNDCKGLSGQRLCSIVHAGKSPALIAVDVRLL